MNRILISIAFLCYSLYVTAQTDTAQRDDNPVLKAQAKRFSTELNVNPFTGKLNLNNTLNQVKFRYFTSPGFAWRIGFNATRIDSTFDDNNPYGGNSYHYTNDRKSTTLGLNLGFEKHFAGTKRLSPYIGLDLSLTNKSVNQDIKENQISTSVKGGWYNTVYLPNNGTQILQLVENAYFRYGLNLVSGFDFYMAKNFYLGYEFSFGFSQTDYKNVEVKRTGPNLPPETPSLNDRENKSFSFGPSLVNGIRIGYVL